MVRDVSQRKELEERLLNVQKMDVAGRLATGVAHDFNNLLTVILGEVSLAESSGERYHGALEEIRRSAERAAALTRQLLTFSRREAPQHETLSVAELVSGMNQMLRRLIEADIELVTDVTEDAGCLRSDRTRIEQVLANLAINARDAMPHGGRLEVAAGRAVVPEWSERTTLPPGDYVRIAVTDTGVGMSDDVKAHLFEPFFTTKARGSGTGLGLATSYDIVQQNGGHIVIDSQVGRGTTVNVYLPRTPCVVRTPLPSVIESEPRGDETVLVVEDDERVRSITARVLRAHGFLVLEAPDATTAVTVARNQRGPIHLLLTDLVLAGTGGRELAKQIQQSYPGVRVLFVTGYGDEYITRRGLLPEDELLLQKPYPPAVLVNRVREVLDRPSTTEQSSI
jgi:CheY-like chemotaxis protein